MNNDANALQLKFNNLQIVPSKKYSIDSLVVSMNKMKIGKKKIVKNNVINNIYTKYQLYSLLNNKLFMDEVVGQVLLKYFRKPIYTLQMIKKEDNYDADNESYIMEID